MFHWLFYSTIVLILMPGIPGVSMPVPVDHAPPVWSAKLDGKLRFYQTTELGALIAGTEKSLYALDGETGEVLWRRKNVRLDETDIAPIIGTDLMLLSLEKNGKTRVEAVDTLSGQVIWQSDKIKGSVMHIAVELEHDLAAVVFVRDAKGSARAGFKKRPTVYMLNLNNGEIVWKRDLESEVEMMPARWPDDQGKESVYTLDNYRAPLFLDGRLYLFYEGVTSLDIQSGKESIRERFRVNEDGLALTEADPVIDRQYIYTSGQGHIKAISRATGREAWEAKDLGLTPEILLTDGVIYVRTGGRFIQLKNGEIAERGPYGVSKIDAASGKVLWRYNGADKGITNIALPDPSTILIADRDEIVAIDVATGKPRSRIKHRIEQASFVLINEPGETVVGGKSEIAAFNLSGTGNEIWRARHEAPGRGVLRTVAAITVRATSLYFRFGGVATTAYRGFQLTRGFTAMRWSGMISRVIVPNLTEYAAGSAHEYVTSQFKGYGIVSSLDMARGVSRLAQARPGIPPISVDIDADDILIDRLDPAHQLERLSRFLFRRKQLAVLRGQYMYFYTDFKDGGSRGLAGVNLNTGQTVRRIRINEIDHRLTTDEVVNQLYLAHDDRLFAFPLNTR
jgi:outer membrane protein assembly factor BamB